MELPYRLINLYSYQNDIVLDPFMGSGTTAEAAIKTARRYIGYEIKQDYVDFACKRVQEISAIDFFDCRVENVVS